MQDFMTSREKHGDLSILDTRVFVSGMKTGQELSVQIEHGKVCMPRKCTSRGRTRRADRFGRADGVPEDEEGLRGLLLC